MANKDSIENIYLGIDHGSKYIGLAFGRSGNVMPLEVIEAKNEEAALMKISRIVLENKVNKLVLGLPLTEDEKETSQSIEARKFAKRLKMYLKLPVDFVTEHSSTKEAVKIKRQLGESVKRATRADHISAAVILKSYFREHEQ